MKIIFIGSNSPLSIIPLQALIKSSHTISAFAFDDISCSDFNIIESGSIQSLAFNNSIPFIKLKNKLIESVEEIKKFEPDLILVSCYARKIPHSIISLATKFCINIHPSLLPRFRGPNPIFWQFKEGEKYFGVTIHKVTSELDAGNILCQKNIIFNDGVNIITATNLLAELASEIMLQTLNDIENRGSEEDIDVIQQVDLASYQPYPEESDYRVRTTWTARRIYNFINAYKETGVSFLCNIEGDEFKLIDAFSYQEEPYVCMGAKESVQEGDTIVFSCEIGFIKCKFEVV